MSVGKRIITHLIRVSKLFLLASLIFLSMDLLPFKSIDPTLEPYYKEFHTLWNESCPNIKLQEDNKFIVVFTKGLFDKWDGAVGLCSKTRFSSLIQVDKGYWNVLTPTEQYSLLMHELLHCELNIGHSDDKRDIMYPSLYDMSHEEITNQTIGYMKENCNEQ